MLCKVVSVLKRVTCAETLNQLIRTNPQLEQAQFFLRQSSVFYSCLILSDFKTHLHQDMWSGVGKVENIFVFAR